MTAEERPYFRPGWWFPEYQPVGVELGTVASVAAYDARQGTDPAADDALLDRLGVGHGTVLVDLACGTGSLAVQAAHRGAEAHGVDVGAEMLASAARRAESAGVGVSWHRAGFLDYVHDGSPVDVVTTKSALHQLPEVFKQEALRRAAAMLRPGGTLYLWDAIFGFDPADAVVELQRWVDAARDSDSFTPEEFEIHIREEYSTYDWIIAGMLERVGLEILEHTTATPTHAEFLSRRPRGDRLGHPARGSSSGICFSALHRGGGRRGRPRTVHFTRAHAKPRAR